MLRNIRAVHVLKAESRRLVHALGALSCRSFEPGTWASPNLNLGLTVALGRSTQEKVRETPSTDSEVDIEQLLQSLNAGETATQQPKAPKTPPQARDLPRPVAMKPTPRAAAKAAKAPPPSEQGSETPAEREPRNRKRGNPRRLSATTVEQPSEGATPPPVAAAAAAAVPRSCSVEASEPRPRGGQAKASKSSRASEEGSENAPVSRQDSEVSGRGTKPSKVAPHKAPAKQPAKVSPATVQSVAPMKERGHISLEEDDSSEQWQTVSSTRARQSKSTRAPEAAPAPKFSEPAPRPPSKKGKPTMTAAPRPEGRSAPKGDAPPVVKSFGTSAGVAVCPWAAARPPRVAFPTAAEEVASPALQSVEAEKAPVDPVDTRKSGQSHKPLNPFAAPFIPSWAASPAPSAGPVESIESVEPVEPLEEPLPVPARPQPHERWLCPLQTIVHDPYHSSGYQYADQAAHLPHKEVILPASPDAPTAVTAGDPVDERLTIRCTLERRALPEATY
eukprot:RCo032914